MKQTSELVFLDSLVTCSQNKLSTSWYTKPLTHVYTYPIMQVPHEIQTRHRRLRNPPYYVKWGAILTVQYFSLPHTVKRTNILHLSTPLLPEKRSRRYYRKRLRHSQTPHCNTKEKRVQLESCLLLNTVPHIWSTVCQTQKNSCVLSNFHEGTWNHCHLSRPQFRRNSEVGLFTKSSVRDGMSAKRYDISQRDSELPRTSAPVA